MAGRHTRGAVDPVPILTRRGDGSPHELYPGDVDRRLRGAARAAEEDEARASAELEHLREVEAEAVALICCESLGLPGAECCRGYIQGWVRHEA